MQNRQSRLQEPRVLPKACWGPHLGCTLAVILIGVSTWAGLAQSDSIQVVFSAGFEPEEGYDNRLELRQQSGWVGEGSGGNGFVTNFFAGRGQHAYIGFNPPAPKDVSLNVWRPVNFDPIGTGYPVVTFSVLMEILDSSNGRYDDFRWSVYDTNGTRLLTVIFDNADLQVYYLLDTSTNFLASGVRFANNTIYDFAISMDFRQNLWSAALGETTITHARRLSAGGTPQGLGDVDAVWTLAVQGRPGDNSMIFDDYWITAERSTAPLITQLDGASGGRFFFSVFGQPALPFVLEDSEDLKTWIPLLTNAMPAAGVKEFVDEDVKFLPARFYRARQR